jgi:hypothetical protein
MRQTATLFGLLAPQEGRIALSQQRWREGPDQIPQVHFANRPLHRRGLSLPGSRNDGAAQVAVDHGCRFMAGLLHGDQITQVLGDQPPVTP